MTSAVHLALRGLFSLSAITLAVQGLIEQIQKTGPKDTDGGMAGKKRAPEMEAYIARLNAEFERKSRVKKANQQAIEIVMALLQSEILDG
jgi:hypothetical protein